MISTFIRKNDDHRLYGLIVSESEKLMMILKENDFQFDGYQIIRKSDLKKVYVSDSNEYCVKLMKIEGMWKVKHPKWVMNLDLSNWHSVFSDMKGRVIIAENESANGSFHIGPIVDISKRAVAIQWFNGVGKLMDVEKINISKISSCKFLDRYSTIHSRYLNSAQQLDSSEPASPAR